MIRSSTLAATPVRNLLNFCKNTSALPSTFTADNARLYANTAFLNLTSQEWTSGPDLTTARWGHTCSLITKSNGDKEIVIVGGRSHTSSGSDPPTDNCTINDVITLRDVEILDLQTYTFRAGEWMKTKPIMNVSWMNNGINVWFQDLSTHITYVMQPK